MNDLLKWYFNFGLYHNKKCNKVKKVDNIYTCIFFTNAHRQDTYNQKQLYNIILVCLSTGLTKFTMVLS